MITWSTPAAELAVWTRVLTDLRAGAETRWIGWRANVEPPATGDEAARFLDALRDFDAWIADRPWPGQVEVRA